MKRIFLVGLIALMAFVPQKRSRVIFFGDSITELAVKPGGFIILIDSICKTENKSDQYEFIGSGVSSNKIYDLYLRLETDVLNKNPDIVIIFIGVNDVWHKRLLGTGTDPDKFEKFYQAIIDKIKSKGSKIIICTPAVIGEKTDQTNEQDGDLNRYCVIIRGLAQKNNLPLIDLRQKFLDYGKANNPQNLEKNILTYDRVHLNDMGNQLVAGEMWSALKKLYAK